MKEDVHGTRKNGSPQVWTLEQFLELSLLDCVVQNDLEAFDLFGYFFRREASLSEARERCDRLILSAIEEVPSWRLLISLSAALIYSKE